MSMENEFARGERQGQVATELAELQKHLDKLDGSMDRVDHRLAEITRTLGALLQAIARIDQAMTADKQTVAATAAALRDQADASGRNSETKWTPFNRALITLSTVAATAGAVYLLIHG